MAFLRRVRARQIKGRVRHWLQVSGGNPHFLGFPGIKAGMTRIAYEDLNKASPYFKKELYSAVTIIEAPPATVFGLRVYDRDYYGVVCLGDVLAKDKWPKELSRKLTKPGESYDAAVTLQKLEKKVLSGSPQVEIRGLFATQPNKTPLPRIRPDVVEIPISGGAAVKQRWEYAKSMFGKEVRIRDIFKTGQVIDVSAVTRGKGFGGVVKRFGIKMRPRKDRKGKRRVGCIGPWKPNRVICSVARMGQDGLHQRTEYHKKIVKISENPEEINPKGGFVRYGLIKNDFAMLEGSVPGARKRMINLRCTIRPVKPGKEIEQRITYVSKNSQQGK